MAANLWCVFWPVISDFTSEIKKKRLKNWVDKHLHAEILETTFSFRKFRAVPCRFRVPLMSVNHVVSNRSQERLSLFTCPPALMSSFKHSFLSVFLDFRHEITEKGLKWKKGLKTAQKSISTSFRVHAAPESWSKHTTNLLKNACYNRFQTCFKLVPNWF